MHMGVDFCTLLQNKLDLSLNSLHTIWMTSDQVACHINHLINAKKRYHKVKKEIKLYFVYCLRFKESYFRFSASWGTLQANIRKHKPACPLVEFASNRCACRYRLLADETSQELLWGKETSLNKVQCFVSQLKSYYSVP